MEQYVISIMSYLLFGLLNILLRLLVCIMQGSYYNVHCIEFLISGKLYSTVISYLVCSSLAESTSQVWIGHNSYGTVHSDTLYNTADRRSTKTAIRRKNEDVYQQFKKTVYIASSLGFDHFLPASGCIRSHSDVPLSY